MQRYLFIFIVVIFVSNTVFAESVRDRLRKAREHENQVTPEMHSKEKPSKSKKVLSLDSLKDFKGLSEEETMKKIHEEYENPFDQLDLEELDSRTHHTIIDGKKHGPTKIYHVNGKLQQEGSYKNNNRQGLFKTYDNKGNLSSEKNYNNGILDGSSKTYSRNGNLRSKDFYKMGKRDGLCKTYHFNGKIHFEDLYKNGNLMESKRFDRNGVLVYQE